MRRIISAFACATVLSACAAPSVSYVQLGGPSSSASVESELPKLTDSYFLDKSLLVITHEGGDNFQAYKVTATKVAFDEFKLGIQAKRSLLSSTKLNVSKLPNTDRVQSIGVETSDHTVKAIKAVAASLAIIGPLGPLSENTHPGRPDCIVSRRPIIVDPTDARFLPGADFTPLDGHPCVSLKIGKLPPDAVDRIPTMEPTSAYYYSSCVDATVRTRGWSQPDAEHTFRISYPKFFQQVEFPFKGSVTMHSECGVSVATEKAFSDTSSLDVVQALAEAFKTVQDGKK